MTIEEIKALPIEERQDKLVEIFMSKKRDFSMFSTAGNRRVQNLVKKCIKKVVNKKAIRQEDFEAYVKAQVKKVEANEKYSEIGDTAVREVIYFWLEKAIKVAGYNWDYFEYE
jgi:uncharacterized protein YbcV (DUF1398 family)